MLRSLAHLMKTPWPSDHPVSWTDAGAIRWQTFANDVQGLTQKISESKRQRWALCFDDSYEFAVACMATLHAGCELILPGNLQPDALCEMTPFFDGVLHDHALDTHLVQRLKDNYVAAVCFCDSSAVQASSTRSDSTHTFAGIDLEHAYITLFTSGSSGTPKAIRKSFRQLDREINELEAVWGSLINGSSIVSTVSHQHIYGLLFRVLWPLCAGRAFNRSNVIYPEQVMEQAGEDVTLISSPALLKRLGDEVPSGTTYRAIFSSGGPLSRQAVMHCENLFNTMPYEVFGSTETGGIGYRTGLEEETPWTLFSPIQMAVDPEGCLRILSPFIDLENWYQTSDHCTLLSDQTFMLNGRLDRVVKIEEKRISLVEVERRLSELEWIDESVVFPIEQSSRFSLVAAITLTHQGQTQIESIGKGPFWIQLRKELRRCIEPVGIPRRFRVLEEIPLNSQGKVSLNVLEDLFYD